MQSEAHICSQRAGRSSNDTKRKLAEKGKAGSQRSDAAAYDTLWGSTAGGTVRAVFVTVKNHRPRCSASTKVTAVLHETGRDMIRGNRMINTPYYIIRAAKICEEKT